MIIYTDGGFEMSEENFNGNVNNEQQSYQQNYGQPYQQNFQDPQDNKTLAIVSMVLGIASIIMVCFLSSVTGAFTWIGLACAVAAIVTGVVNKNKFGKNPMATAGFVCGIVAIALWVLAIILVIAGIGLIASMA